MPKYPLIHLNTPEWSSRSQGEVASTLLLKFLERKWSPAMRCDNFCSHTSALFGNDAFIKFVKQKVGHDNVILNGNELGHAWQTWCKNDTNGKRMTCSLLICHMQIFKLIDIRTMGLWKWITFILIRTV